MRFWWFLFKCTKIKMQFLNHVQSYSLNRNTNENKKITTKICIFFQYTKNHDLDDTLNDDKSITKNFFDTNL